MIVKPTIVPAVPFDDGSGGEPAGESLPTPAPEPYTVLLFGGALIGLALFEAHRRMQAAR